MWHWNVDNFILLVVVGLLCASCFVYSSQPSAYRNLTIQELSNIMEMLHERAENMRAIAGISRNLYPARTQAHARRHLSLAEASTPPGFLVVRGFDAAGCTTNRQYYAYGNIVSNVCMKASGGGSLMQSCLSNGGTPAVIRYTGT